jgi:membrane protein
MDPLTTTGIDTELGWRTQWRRFVALRWTDILDLLKTTFAKWYEHNVPRLGASVTFYTLLSLAPLLIIVVAVASAVFGRQAAEGQLVWQIRGVMGQQGAETVQALLRGAQSSGVGTVASMLGAITLFFGATAVVAELRDALNTIWCVPKRQQTAIRGLLSILVERTLAFASVLGLGFLLLVSLAVNAGIAAVSSRYQLALPAPEFALHTLELAVSFGVLALLFALIYKVLPDLPLEWRDVIPGAIVTALLFSAGKVAIGLYLGRASIGSTYGAAGSLVILLFWVYYSAQIFFLGAEFTQAYAQTFGSRPCDRVQKHVEIVSSPSKIDHPEDAEPAEGEATIITPFDSPEPGRTAAPVVEIVTSSKEMTPNGRN